MNLKRQLLLTLGLSKQSDSLAGYVKKQGLIPYSYSLLGINIDEDVEVAKMTARNESLPGMQFYDAQGPVGTIATQLKFVSPHSIYIADETGVLVDICGYEGTFAKLAKLLKKLPAGIDDLSIAIESLPTVAR